MSDHAHICPHCYRVAWCATSACAPETLRPDPLCAFAAGIAAAVEAERAAASLLAIVEAARAFVAFDERYEHDLEAMLTRYDEEFAAFKRVVLGGAS